MAIKTVIFRMEPEEFDEAETRWRRAGFKTLQEAGIYAFRTAFEQSQAGEVPARYRPTQGKLAKLLAVCEDEEQQALDTVLDALLRQAEVRRKKRRQ